MKKQNNWLKKHKAYIDGLAKDRDYSSTQIEDVKSNLYKPIKTYSAGVVSGLTGLPQSSIRRYIILFRNHFSVLARQPHRGRKFTNQDVELLTFIKQEFKDRRTIPEIETALGGEWKAIQDDRNQKEIIRIGLKVIEMQEQISRDAANIRSDVERNLQIFKVNEQNISDWNKGLNDVVQAHNNHMRYKLTAVQWLKGFFSNKIHGHNNTYT